MKKSMRWIFAMILVLCMVFSTVGIRSYAAGTEGSTEEIAEEIIEKPLRIGEAQFHW